MSKLLTGMLLAIFSLNVYSVEKLDTEQYAQLQNCMAVAFDVADNGSYEQFCINRYLSEKTNNMNK